MYYFQNNFKELFFSSLCSNSLFKIYCLLVFILPEMISLCRQHVLGGHHIQLVLHCPPTDTDTDVYSMFENIINKSV